MRPNEDILNEFYGLVELNAQKRYEAVSRLYMKVKSDPSVQEYCVERLIAGLSSTRAAARFGYGFFFDVIFFALSNFSSYMLSLFSIYTFKDSHRIYKLSAC
ncbi:unnamed protein product [Cylicostephanus goldi]|uniref:Uncharacterized protein n=1 Tax=Cylicostephanus goldi TaxID=71465 RepID=A0A3P6QYN8_CYLGO|nr:unnamed protein product [Cylicostephanus goldi]